MSTSHLVGAHGMFWLREEVEWGMRGWQLLGKRGERRPKLEICDFRRARGFYILFDDHGATYVGLAEGKQGGIGARLHQHNRRRGNWNRFCWFAFDDVGPHTAEGWSKVNLRSALRNVGSHDVVKECEALLITVLGTHKAGPDASSRGQNRMEFMGAGASWAQLRAQDFAPDGVARKVDTSVFTNKWLLGGAWGDTDHS